MFGWIFGRKKKIEIDTMKFLIVGLGNMGAEYDQTRHNVGFEVVDKVAGEHKYEHERLGDLASIKHKGRQIYLLKPSTYMNLSGKAVRYWMDKLKINTENVLIITDDINIPFGSIRIRANGSDGGHNGLKSIQELLGHHNYNRMRIGVGAEFGKGRQVEYVLGKWTQEEADLLPKILENAKNAILTFCTQGLSTAMNQYNKK